MTCKECTYKGQGTKICPICYQKLLKKHRPLTSNEFKFNKAYQDDFNKHISDKEIEIIKYNFDKLTKEQQEFFLKMYKNIDTIPRDKRSWAYSQIMRTLNERE